MTASATDQKAKALISPLSAAESQVILRVTGFGIVLTLLLVLGIATVIGALNAPAVSAVQWFATMIVRLIDLEVYLSNLLFVWPSIHLLCAITLLATTSQASVQIQQRIAQTEPGAPKDTVLEAARFIAKSRARVQRVELGTVYLISGLGLAAFFIGICKMVLWSEETSPLIGYTVFMVLSSLLALMITEYSLSLHAYPHGKLKFEHSNATINKTFHTISPWSSSSCGVRRHALAQIPALLAAGFIHNHPAYSEEIESIQRNFKEV